MNATASSTIAGASKQPSVTSACRCTNKPKSLRKRCTTMSTPGFRLLPLRNPCSRLLCCRSACITRFANHRHTLPSSRRS